ncbi:hypothetical protein EYC84_004487 [Monilinia fructicola]|uniref:Uncharacterized protein n=1 Tax=Monilinia fructicola TaxID=38448 RepID=A0A5M9K5L4_MONFR|nr:hypothetical protein EYC84_004487 [Monilinia fructicola]
MGISTNEFYSAPSMNKACGKDSRQTPRRIAAGLPNFLPIVRYYLLISTIVLRLNFVVMPWCPEISISRLS